MATPVPRGFAFDLRETFSKCRYLGELGVLASALRARSGSLGLVSPRPSLLQRQVPQS